MRRLRMSSAAARGFASLALLVLAGCGQRAPVEAHEPHVALHFRAERVPTAGEWDEMLAVLDRRLIEAELPVHASAHRHDDDTVELRVAGDELDEELGQRVTDLFELQGRLEFLAVASLVDPVDLVEERDRLVAWLEGGADRTVAGFNVVSRDAGGPDPALVWHVQRPLGEDYRPPPRDADHATPCLLPAREEDRFKGEDLSEVYISKDNLGFPAIGFELRDSRRGDFADFTERLIDRQLAIVIEDEIISAPMVEDRLTGASIIRGGLEEGEVRRLVAQLRAGPLPVSLRRVELE